MSRHFAHEIFRNFDTNFALDIFDIFVVFRLVATTLILTLIQPFANTHTHTHQGAKKQQTRPDQKCLREASRHNDRVRADTSPQGRHRLHEVHLEFDDARLTLLRPSHHPQHDRLLPEARRPNPHQTAPEHREHSANCHLLPQWHFYGDSSHTLIADTFEPNPDLGLTNCIKFNYFQKRVHDSS